MGDPRKTRKHFKRPLKIWDKANLEKEKALLQGYGLKNKREIWRTETMLRKKRQNARSLLALPLEERLKREQQLLLSLARVGILDEKASLDDVLTMAIESFLERRLQTLVWRKGLANTARQSRQFIIHGHIAIGGKRVTAPSYLVNRDEENKIGYYADKKMVLMPPVKEKKVGKKPGEEKKSVKEEFEEAKPAEAKKGARPSSEEAMKAVREARAKAKVAEGVGSKEREGEAKIEKLEKDEKKTEKKEELVKREKIEKTEKREKDEKKKEELVKGEKKTETREQKVKGAGKPADREGRE